MYIIVANLFRTRRAKFCQNLWVL